MRFLLSENKLVLSHTHVCFFGYKTIHNFHCLWYKISIWYTVCHYMSMSWFLIVQGKITVDFVSMYSLWEPRPLYCLCVTTRDGPERTETKWDRGFGWGSASNGTWKTHLGARRGDEDEWQAPGRAREKKKIGVSSKHGDRLVRSCRQLSLPSRRGDESEEGRDGGGSKAQGTSNKVRWLHYRSIIQHVFDKLPCKGKNKQSCTV